MLYRKLIMTPIQRAGLLTATVLISAGVSQAQITGELWLNDGNASDATIAAALAEGTPDATFSSGAINYQSQVSGYTVGGFLNNPTFNNTSANFTTDGGASANLNNTFFYFTGTLYLNAGDNSFVVAHDDGLQLSIGGGIGLVVDSPFGQAENFTPFTVTAPSAGDYTFQLAYGECEGPPADLVWTINQQTVGAPVPDAATTGSLLGIGLVALGAFGRRIKL